MKLYWKTFLLLFTTLVVVLVGSLLVANAVVVDGFRTLEKESVLRDVERADQALRDDLRALEAAAKGWAEGDDARRFVLGNGTAFGERDLQAASLSANRLNLVLLLNATGALVYGTGFDPATQALQPLPAPFASLPPAHPLLQPRDRARPVSGLVTADGRPMEVVSWPVLDRGGEGPPAGTLVWGRWLDDALALHLGQRTRLDLQLLPWPAALPQAAGQLAHLADDGSTAVLEMSSSSLVALQRRDGLDGHPALLLQLELPRPIYGEGVRTLAYLLASGVLGGGALLAAVVVALDRTVLLPVRRLTDQVVHARTSGGHASRVDVHSSDEIGGLAAEFNRLMERLDRHAAELERSNEDLRQFASVVSHDLQPPLSTLTLNVAVLRQRAKGHLDSESLARLDRMELTAHSMARLMNAILEYSRVSYEPMRREDVALNYTLAEVAGLLEADLARSGGELRSANLPAVRGNATQLLQLLQNLVGNALKFRRPGVPPRVEVTAERCADGAGWRVTVADNGTGFNPDLIPLLFRPFSRGLSDAPGFGLGLATCSKIVARHGGRIGVDTIPGQGSRFWFEIPDEETGPLPSTASP
ncbi:MAG TPA: CHASE4 domain-containing protein [Candidatus Thermoplasmatota archaeon]|nr:CHASE4 domain-containing protein [Candidatus Thermoplasmatota archaeon]